MKDSVSFERGTPWGMLIYNDFEIVCSAEFLPTNTGATLGFRVQAAPCTPSALDLRASILGF